ncbi:MAG TPA: BrnT family toxin [Alloacidobacterium sp.]|nr:BrnT family toxin [Alloacidobacterium sp.]
MIVWDEAKRQANLKKHGLDFADAHLVYENPEKVTFISPRNAEERKLDVAIVEMQGRALTLVYVERGENIRAISFRPSSRVERKAYGKAHAEK